MTRRASDPPPASRAALGERRLVELLVRGWPRSPRQLNGLYEADAELVRMAGPGDPPGPYLAATTDSISEEVESGLYVRGEEIGWMAVTASASDLAAVGAEPLGVLLDLSVPAGSGERLVRRLGRGVRDAGRAYGLPVLGGDTNRSSTLRIGSTALGWVPGRPLTRLGARPGHLIYTTGPAGHGSSVALRRLLEEARPRPDPVFRPRARLRAGARLRGLASACVDTSDGLLPALHELLRLNHVGAALEPPVTTLLRADALEAAERHGLPGWIFLSGPHGDYELLFTLPPEERRRLEGVARGAGFRPVRVGRVVEARGISLRTGGDVILLDPAEVTGLFDRVGGGPASYLEGLLRIHERAVARARRRPAPERPPPAASSGPLDTRSAALPALDRGPRDSPPSAPDRRARRKRAASRTNRGDTDDESRRSQADAPGRDPPGWGRM